MTKVLTREAIQRMIGTGGSNRGTVSVNQSEDGMGSAWVGNNFVGIPYFNTLFTIHGKKTVTVTDGTTGTVTVTTEDTELPPNVTPYSETETDETTGDVTVTEITIESVEVKYNFWSDGGVSALGQNAGGGGGGGADLNALLASINSSSIGNVAPTSSEVGKCLVYNGNGSWVWASPGGGGTGSGTVTSISAGIGLVSSTGGSITTSGSLSVDESMRVRMVSSTSYLGARFYGNDGNVDNTRAGLASDNGYIEWWQNSKWMNHAMGHLILTNTDNQIWGDTLGNKKFTLPSTSGTLALVSDLPTSMAWANITGKPSTLAGYGITDAKFVSGTADTIAIKLGSTTQSVLTAHQSLAGYATEQWVTNKGYTTNTGTVTRVATGTGLTGGPITTSGTISINSTYQTYISHGESAYNDLSLYLLKTQGMRFMTQENYVAARFVTATGAYDNERAAKAQGDGYIEWWSDGGYFNHEMGWIRAKGNVTIGESTTDTTHYLQIGGGKLCWDNTNKALYVQQADGTAAHFYATGGVSALGMGASGTASLNTLTLGSLSVTGNAILKTLSVSTKLTLPSEIVASGNPMIVRQSNDSDCIYLFGGYAQAATSGYDYYYNQYDNVGLKGTDNNYSDSWNIDPDGNAVFSKLTCGTALIMSNYVYINQRCRLYANGGTVSLQIRANTTTNTWVTKETWS